MFQIFGNLDICINTSNEICCRKKNYHSSLDKNKVYYIVWVTVITREVLVLFFY